MLLGLFPVLLAQAPPPIVNGEKTSDYEAVGILYHEEGNMSGICSASLIHKQWVVTAAHCVESMEGGGTTYFMIGNDINTADGISRYTTVREMYGHPEYDGANSGYHDIGLMKLTNTMSNVELIPVNDDRLSNTNMRGELVTYVGWGNNADNGNGSGVKRTADVPIYEIQSRVIYTHDDTGRNRNICSGDSGGAMLFPTSGGVLELIGINAFGIMLDGSWPVECDDRDAAAGATRVDIYYDWVTDYVDLTPIHEGDTDTDSDADTDTDSDSDSDTDSDTDSDADADNEDSGWWDEDLPDRPSGVETIDDGCASAGSSSAGPGALLLVLLGLMRRRR